VQPQARQLAPAQHKLQHHPRMAIQMSISKNSNRALSDGGRRVVITPSSPAASAAPPRHQGEARGRGGAARGVGSSRGRA
jgi:hypothetical protein